MGHQCFHHPLPAPPTSAAPTPPPPTADRLTHFTLITPAPNNTTFFSQFMAPAPPRPAPPRPLPTPRSPLPAACCLLLPTRLASTSRHILLPHFDGHSSHPPSPSRLFHPAPTLTDVSAALPASPPFPSAALAPPVSTALACFAALPALAAPPAFASLPLSPPLGSLILLHTLYSLF
ncbi:hypothetical protein B0H14DRAFT_3536448 [Mycena olivaceomarginata]|nr:hypothetical protein B0H14DRAFT_3536448 [Mycena olivaceomarginata]